MLGVNILGTKIDLSTDCKLRRLKQLDQEMTNVKPIHRPCLREAYFVWEVAVEDGGNAGEEKEGQRGGYPIQKYQFVIIRSSRTRRGEYTTLYSA